MAFKFKFFLSFITLLTNAYPALAEGGEGGGNQQTPVVVIVQIVITAIVMRILHIFKLP